MASDNVVEWGCPGLYEVLVLPFGLSPAQIIQGQALGVLDLFSCASAGWPLMAEDSR